MGFNSAFKGLIMSATVLYTKLLKSHFIYFNLLQVGIRKKKLKIALPQNEPVLW